MRSATAMQLLVTALVNIMKTCSSNVRGHVAFAVSLKYYLITQNIILKLLFIIDISSIPLRLYQHHVKFFIFYYSCCGPLRGGTKDDVLSREK